MVEFGMDGSRIVLDEPELGLLEVLELTDYFGRGVTLVHW